MQFACRAKLKGKLLVPALNHYDTFASFKICSCLHGYIATRPPIGYNVVIIVQYLTLFAPFYRMTNSISFLQLEVSQD